MGRWYATLRQARPRFPVGSRRASGDDHGFTLLELLIVLVILGVMAAIVVFAVGGMDQASAVTACRSDYKTVETALGAYEGEKGSSATSVNQLVGVWLREPPGTSDGYVIGIDPSTGNVTVQSTSPAHAAADGNANCAYA
jgi:prepilin-type N-terminal cleavage/methylation domain-containing protein